MAISFRSEDIRSRILNRRYGYSDQTTTLIAANNVPGCNLTHPPGALLLVVDTFEAAGFVMANTARTPAR